MVHNQARMSNILFRTLCLALFTTTASSAFFLDGLMKSVQTTKTTSPPDDVQILILPGFGNDSIDYTMEKSLVPSLIEKGWKPEQISVLPVQRTDWLQVFTNGIFDIKFWTADAGPTRPAFRWYLERISDEISSTTAATTTSDDGNKKKFILIGHSAGGWLGRAALGFGSTDDDAPPIDLSRVLGIVTLGAPNLPPPPGVMDMTRGALRITNERFPGAFHSPSLFYLTAIGLAVQGKRQERQSPLERDTLEGFAFNSYEAVCGDGTAIGDGVVPQCAGHLDDAIQVRFLFVAIGCSSTCLVFVFGLLCFH